MPMDQHQFDLVARRFATAANRRALFRAALTAIAAAALGGTRRSALAQGLCPDGCAEGQLCTERGCVTPCANHRDCRNKHDDPCELNTCVEGFCTTAIIECLPGSHCCEGECCATSCELDAECTSFDPCLWGRCGVDGRCEFTELDPCVVCTSDEECIGSAPDTVCCDGACRRPCPQGMVMGKGCECHVYGSVSLDGVVVHDDASG
jgi:hypothetical protein